jgi:predicted RNA-binding Zn ribbon-like protein
MAGDDYVLAFVNDGVLPDAPDEEPTAAQVAKLRRLREVLRSLGELVAGGQVPTDEELGPLNRFVTEVPVEISVRRADDRVVLVRTALATGWDEAIRELAGRFAGLLARRDPARFKLCGNADCERLFYDASRNRTGRWCGGACGNRARVRRHRAGRAS